MNFIIDIVKALMINFPFMIAMLSLAIAQMIKIIYYWNVDGKIDLWHFVEAGGMPSAHSAMVCSLTMSLGLVNGFSSPFFALAIIFSIIVMYDAMGVRRLAGKQALVLNKMIEEGKISSEKLSGLIGHSALEVFFGGILGICVAIVMYFLIYW